jgi:hypothetical protein
VAAKHICATRNALGFAVRSPLGDHDVFHAIRPGLSPDAPAQSAFRAVESQNRCRRHGRRLRSNHFPWTTANNVAIRRMAGALNRCVIRQAARVIAFRVEHSPSIIHNLDLNGAWLFAAFGAVRHERNG